MKRIKRENRAAHLLRLWAALSLSVCLCLMLPCTAPADIYRYIDAQGVVHFTNTPTDQGYTLYLKEKKYRRGPARSKSAQSKRFRSGSDVYDNIILKAAGTFGVDRALIKAVIHAESGFDPNAVSRKGARGLMQIMPKNDIALEISNPFDPAQNIMGGTQYLKRMLTRYNEKLSLALAAYNAGPSAVDKYNNIPPYEETRTYVQRVMALYSRYKNS